MVISPQKTPFVVDVKGQYLKGFWNARPKKPRPDLFYVFAYVPDNAPNQFFILSQDQLAQESKAFLERSRQKRAAKGQSIEKVGIMPGLPWAVAEKFSGKWGILPK